MSSLINTIKKFSLKILMKISLFIAIIFLIFTCIFLIIAGTSTLLLQGAFVGNRFAIVIGIVLTSLITTVGPTSLVSILLPEATISKVAGTLGISTAVASVIVLFIICLFLSSFGVLIFGFLGLFFLTISLYLRKYSDVKKSTLIIIASLFCIMLGLWLIIAILSIGIWQINILIAILALLFIIYAIILLLPYFKRKIVILSKKT